MYRFAQSVGPAQLKAIAAQLYLEMLEQGYTEVCEFHYLHHQPNGQPYADPATMSLALIEAAREVGIGLTLLPTLYMSGHFDGRPLSERQQRFGHASVDDFLRLVESLLVHEDANTRIGIALHSLRAVPPQALREVLSGFADRRFASAVGARPVHLHIAEQTAEVEDCVNLRGAPPVRWLLDNVEVDARWCLVHATHLREDEIVDLARSGATVAICPTTEANLGDGIFPLAAFQAAGGRFGIGSDSHVSISPVEELRWLEYAQRLNQRQRIVAADGQGRVGEYLLAESIAAGPRVARSDLPGLWQVANPTARLDFISIDTESPELATVESDRWIDAWLFSGNRPLITEVMVNGRIVVRGGRHPAREAVAKRFAEACRELREPA